MKLHNTIDNQNFLQIQKYNQNEYYSSKYNKFVDVNKNEIQNVLHCEDTFLSKKKRDEIKHQWKPT